MKMTRRNFLSTSAVAAFACGASLTAHAAGSTDENSLNFITDIFKDPTQPGEIEEATAITAEKNAEWYEKLDFSDRREFANAERGWLDNAEGRIIDGEDNRSAWDLQSYGDLNRDAPDTVNPSLWRNTQLNAKAGLFEVCDGIYQVRGFDMANTTFIRTDHGWIVFDVLMCADVVIGNHGQTTGDCLQHHVTKGIRLTGKGKNICACVGCCQLMPTKTPHKDYVFGCGHLAESDTVRPITHNHKLDIDTLLDLQGMEAFNQHINFFFG